MTLITVISLKWQRQKLDGNSVERIAGEKWKILGADLSLLDPRWGSSWRVPKDRTHTHHTYTHVIKRGLFRKYTCHTHQIYVLKDLIKLRLKMSNGTQMTQLKNGSKTLTVTSSKKNIGQISIWKGYLKKDVEGIEKIVHLLFLMYEWKTI